ncbi:unnamed protein product [Gongylonema pulchrum]|uniref:NARG2_C domain-containing protein n=1 Tax=Gongylonema pulchrum TaxID=637853 RepID=A0A183DPR5_9BILA|nr:unnamed protein product [Gongylonema pulchrum]
MDEKLAAERMEYQKLALQSLSDRKKPIYGCDNHRVISYILDRLRTRAASLNCDYEAAVHSQEMKGLFADALTVMTKKTTLHIGDVPKIILPNERRRFMFSRSIDEISKHFPAKQPCKYRIESDELALHLANRHGVRVVMCASSVMKILSNPWVGDSPNYVIPVVVKCHFSERTNRFENTCLVGKPCVEKAINGPSAWRRFVKFSIKLALYDNKPAKKTGGRQRASFTKSWAKTTDGSSEMKDGAETPRTSAACDDEDDRGTLLIAEEEEEEKPAAPESASMNKKKADGARNAKPDAATPSGTTTSTSFCDDILGDIMNEMNYSNRSDWSNDYGGLVEEGGFSRFEGADLSKRYALFSLGHDGTQDVDLLIRGNIDGIDSTGSELSIAFKLEYAAEFGAENLDDEEFLQDYFRCKLKGASQILRLRMRAYVRQDELKTLYFDDRIPSVQEAFRGIDEHLVLVYHIVQKRIPASFGPKKNNEQKDGKNNDLPSTVDIVSTRSTVSSDLTIDTAKRDAPAKQQPPADDIFGEPVPEFARVERNTPTGHPPRRGRKRPRGNFRRGARAYNPKRSRFVDFDAPSSQGL